MRRLSLLLTTLVVLSIFATACGSSESDTNAGAGSTDDTDPDSTSDSATDDSDLNSVDLSGDVGNPPADGEILGAGPYPIGDITIAVRQDGSDAAAVSYRLACLGDTATLSGEPAPSSAAAMCLALNDDAVRTRLLDGLPTDQMCTEIYGGPEVATIEGALDGTLIKASFDRANGCGIDDWDRLMSAFLPIA